MASFTFTQGRYLAFIHAYTNLHGCPPAESEIAAAICVSPPSVNQMVKMLERKGLIARTPGQPRSLRVLVPEDEIPSWNGRKEAKSPAGRTPSAPVVPASPPARLYVFTVFLVSGPADGLHNKRLSRVIEIRGDQTLQDLHVAIFHAFDRTEEHLYEFQLGKRPFDPAGPNFGPASETAGRKDLGDASATTLDGLEMKIERVFGYWFDFGDDWYHQVQLDRIETAIPTVTYPRVIRRVGKSPPQHAAR